MTTRKKRWPVALEGIIANLLLGALFTWSVYRSPLLVLFPTWTEGMLSAAFGIHNIFTCLGIMFGGKLSGRFSKRKLFFAFACMELIGLGGIAFLPVSMPSLSFVLIVVLFTVIAAFGIGMGINVVQSATLPWFPDRTGLMSGGLYMALGLSSFLLAALSRTTLPILGTKLSFASIGLLIFVVSLLILADRRALLSPKAPEEAAADVPLEGEGMGPRQMLRSPSFWLLFIWNGCMRGAGFILLDHAANIAVAFAASALIGMLISPANGFGSLSLGALLDRLGLKRNMLVVCLLITASALLLILGGRYGVTIAIILGLVLGGMAYGGSSSTYAAAIKLVYGQKHFSANFGFSNFSLAFGAVISTCSGYVLDLSGGSYNSIFLMIAGLLVPIVACSIAFQRIDLSHRGGSRHEEAPRELPQEAS